MLSDDEKAWGRKHRALLRSAADVVAANADDETLLSMPALFDLWAADVAYKADVVLRHGDMLYRVVQAHTSQAHQPPGGTGMLAIYRPVQVEAEPDEVLPWVGGEALEVGAKRSYNGVVYEAYTAVGANIWPPPSVPALWRAVA